MFGSAFAAGTLSGAVLLFFSHVAPMWGGGEFVRDTDVPRVFGRSITRREAQLIGAFIHIIVSGLFGGAYAVLVSFGIFSGYDIVSLLSWSFVVSIFMGGVVLPLEGHGVFGIKEDSWFPIDLVITSALWSVLFWWIIRLWVA